MLMQEVIKHVLRKRVRLGLLWNKCFINFCTIGFTGDNTLIFTSKFHVKDGVLELGTLTGHGHQIVRQERTDKYEIKNGFHISLHPRGQVMHLRENPKGKVLSEKKFEWFPVKTPFHLLSLHSPPLDTCEKSKKTTPFFAPAPEHYKDSILVKVDIFPRERTQHLPYEKAIWFFWGYCPAYLVRVSFILSNQRTAPIVYWPLGDGKIEQSEHTEES